MHPDLEQELTAWWMDRARTEIIAVVPKMQEYGSGDLVEVGRTLARVAGRKVGSAADAAELGIFFYLVGKMARWADAVESGRRVSDDTLFDIGVYVRMAQRVRVSGGWPGEPAGWQDDNPDAAGVRFEEGR